MRKITTIILMIGVIATLLGGCHTSPSGTEASSSPAVSTPAKSPAKSPVVTLSIKPSTASPSPSVTPETSPEPSQSKEIERKYIYGQGERLWAEDITLEQAMRFIIFADYLYPSEYLEINRVYEETAMGAINDEIVYDWGVIDDAYEEKGFEIFKSYYKCFYTDKALEW